MKKQRFDAVIREGRGGGTLIEIPFDVEAVFGTRGRVKVRASFDGSLYRGSIAPMGGTHVLGIRKQIRAEIGKSVGDTVRVELEQDQEPRTVDVPEELEDALKQAPEAKAYFDGLAYTYRKEYARWIASAKRDETRERRLARAIAKLSRREKL